jgi:hypothetical protein
MLLPNHSVILSGKAELFLTITARDVFPDKYENIQEHRGLWDFLIESGIVVIIDYPYPLKNSICLNSFGARLINRLHEIKGLPRDTIEIPESSDQEKREQLEFLIRYDFIYQNPIR